MATRITLFHNPKAGLLEHSKEEILKALQKRGYTTAYVDIKAEDISEYLNDPGDLVVIAGGDGTIRKISRHMVGKGIPIGLLPLGTANNIATSMGLQGKPIDIIDRWQLSWKKPFNIGLAKSAHDESFFLESVGFGLLSRLIRQRPRAKNGKTSREEELKEALQHQQQILNEYVAHPCTIYIEEQQLSGNYILVEAMNTHLAGPNIPLAPNADPGDDLLDVVLVREEEREKLAEHFAKQKSAKGDTGHLNIHRAKQLLVEWHGQHYHVDDKAHENSPPIKLDIQLVAKGLEFLLI